MKIGGRPLYKAARAGRTIERSARTITIFELAVLGVSGCSARIAVSCSAGTYVRTLCEDIGKRLGVPAHLGVLLRTQAGPFGLASAQTPSSIAADPIACLVDPLDVVPLTRVEIDDAGANAFSHGNPVAVDRPTAAPADDVLVTHGGRLIGVGRMGDALAPVKVFQRR